MKNLEDIFAPERSASDIIEDLKYYKTFILSLPKWEDLKKEYDPRLHEIMDRSKFRDKEVRDQSGEVMRMEYVTRVAIGLQRLAATRLSQFMFTIPVVSMCEDTSDQVSKDQFNSVQKVLKRNRWNSLNKKRCEIISSQCECATYWYTVKKKNKKYAFESDLELRSKMFSPSLGDQLFPTFDDGGDMIAFSRGYNTLGANNERLNYFECWTDEKYYRWKESTEWILENDQKHTIGKIPVIYAYREQPIWQDGDHDTIKEIELLLSRNGETIHYHASPVLLINGKMKGMPKKGESGKVLVSEEGNGDAKYVSWQQAPDSVRFQFETLMRLFFQEIQLPDISFENIKGMGAQTSESRKWLLIDPHMKVGSESNIYEDLLTREYNLIKAFIGKMNTKWDSTINELEIEPLITPFSINDDKTTVDILVSATGGKQIMSQKLAVKTYGATTDPDAELAQIQEEQRLSSTLDIFQPAN